MSKDVIVDRYARLYEFPRQLANNGSIVCAICLDYRHVTSGEWHQREPSGRVHWQSLDAGGLIVPGLLRHAWHLFRELRRFGPEVVLSASDSYHVVLGHWVAYWLNVPHVVDLYDNFASIGPGRMPLMAAAYRHAVSRAAAVTCVSEPLEAMVRGEYAARGRTLVLESTINDGEFSPRNKVESRRRFSLPQHARIVGYAGALDTSRDIECLYSAFSRVAFLRPDVHLALAGPVGRPAVPKDRRVHYVGQLPHSAVPDFLSAIDVGVICLRDSQFGRYSFPQKAYEMLAAKVAVLASRVGAMADLFAEYPECTFTAGSVDELEAAIARQLRNPVVPDIPVPTWEQQGQRLAALLREIAADGGSR